MYRVMNLGVSQRGCPNKVCQFNTYSVTKFVHCCLYNRPEVRCQLTKIWISKETSAPYLQAVHTVTTDKPLDEARKFSSKLVLSKSLCQRSRTWLRLTTYTVTLLKLFAVALVNAVMNLRVPYNAGNFLTSSELVSFWRRTLPHAVSNIAILS